MSNQKTSATPIYLLGLLVVVLCVGAGWTYKSHERCTRVGGEWGWLGCSK